jgi:hypothetical protein
MEADIVIVILDVDRVNFAQLVYCVLKKIVACVAREEEARFRRNLEWEERRELMSVVVSHDNLGDVDSSIVPVTFGFILDSRILYVPSGLPAAVSNTVEIGLHVPLLACERYVLGVRELVVVVAGEAVGVLVVAESQLYRRESPGIGRGIESEYRYHQYNNQQSFFLHGLILLKWKIKITIYGDEIGQ